MPAVVAAWVRDAAGDDLKLVLRAVNVRVTASRERVEVRGALPLATSPGAAAPFATVASGVAGDSSCLHEER